MASRGRGLPFGRGIPADPVSYYNQIDERRRSVPSQDTWFLIHDGFSGVSNQNPTNDKLFISPIRERRGDVYVSEGRLYVDTASSTSGILEAAIYVYNRGTTKINKLGRTEVVFDVTSDGLLKQSLDQPILLPRDAHAFIGTVQHDADANLRIQSGTQVRAIEAGRTVTGYTSLPDQLDLNILSEGAESVPLVGYVSKEAARLL